MEIGMPTGAISNMPIGSRLLLTINPLTTRLVEVETRVTELESIEENASGRSNRAGLVLVFRARPMTIGRKNAVVAVLLMNAPRTQEVTITIQNNRSGLSPVWASTARPA